MKIKARKEIGPFKRAGQWVKKHYKTIALSAEGILLLYSLYIHNKYAKEMNALHKKQIELLLEKEKALMTKEQQAMKRLNDLGFQEYLKEKHGIDQLRGAKK